MSETDAIGEAETLPTKHLSVTGTPLFVGFKLEGSLKRELQALEGPDRKYVSDSDSTYLRLCRDGDDLYVGKVIEDGLFTDRVEDVCRNVLSILRRLSPDTRLPTKLEIRPVAVGYEKSPL